jgi:hypothetical protein
MSRLKPIITAVLLVASTPVLAQQTMSADVAREFVADRTFSYQCFDGTIGSGRIFNDGSASGSIKVMGKGQTRFLHLPTNTLYVAGSQICARLKGLPFEPCFNLVRTGPDSFRGSISHLTFMYCNFNRGGVTQLARRRGTGENTQKTEKAEKIEQKPAEASSVGGDMQLRR